MFLELVTTVHMTPSKTFIRISQITNIGFKNIKNRLNP